jgi:PTH1 family peptidyl-tRNA hydrolase
MIELIAFLGNPGKQYCNNRHNAGRLAAIALVPFNWQKKYKGLYVTTNTTHFLMPETYMNLSGESVSAAVSFLKIPINHILVVHDELDLPLGTISLKYSGGLNGHNGLRSLKMCLTSVDFWRLRIGIGRPEYGTVFDWVLSDFGHDEQQALAQIMPACIDLLQQIMQQEPENLLPGWGKRKIL